VPRIVRIADVAWEGSVARGTGVATASSSGAFSLPISLPSRIGEPGGETSPEELLAAAHAGCFVTSLGSEIARARGTVARIDVRCTVTMDEVEGKGHQVVASDLEAIVEADGIDETTLATIAAEADAGCPFSTLLRASASVSVSARLAP
jgi:lipoyl-dependent peroxiredoxin